MVALESDEGLLSGSPGRFAGLKRKWPTYFSKTPRLRLQVLRRSHNQRPCPTADGEPCRHRLHAPWRTERCGSRLKCLSLPPGSSTGRPGPRQMGAVPKRPHLGECLNLSAVVVFLARHQHQLVQKLPQLLQGVAAHLLLVRVSLGEEQMENCVWGNLWDSACLVVIFLEGDTPHPH